MHGDDDDVPRRCVCAELRLQRLGPESVEELRLGVVNDRARRPRLASDVCEAAPGRRALGHRDDGRGEDDDAPGRRRRHERQEQVREERSSDGVRAQRQLKALLRLPVRRDTDPCVIDERVYARVRGRKALGEGDDCVTGGGGGTELDKAKA